MQNINAKTVICSLLAFLPIVLLVSCAQKQDVAGKWQEVGKKSTLEFHSDGTFNAVDDMGMAVRGKYTLQKNGDIRFEVLHEGSSPEVINGKLIVHGDKLSFATADEKEVETYERVK